MFFVIEMLVNYAIEQLEKDYELFLIDFKERKFLNKSNIQITRKDG